MIRTTAVPRQLRVGAAAASVAGIALLAGCSGTTATPTETKAADVETTAAATPAPDATADGGAAASDSVYTDGTYTAEGSYSTPESVEKITVTVAVADDIVTSVKVTGNPHQTRVGAIPGSVHRRHLRRSGGKEPRRGLGQPGSRIVADERRVQPGHRGDPVRSGRMTPASVWSFDAIGTAWRIETESALPGAARAEITQTIEQFDRAWSRFRGDSLVSALALGARSVPAPPDAGIMLDAYAALSAATDGAVNPLIGDALARRGYDADYSFADRGAQAAPADWQSGIDLDC